MARSIISLWTVSLVPVPCRASLRLVFGHHSKERPSIREPVLTCNDHRVRWQRLYSLGNKRHYQAELDRPELLHAPSESPSWNCLACDGGGIGCSNQRLQEHHEQFCHHELRLQVRIFSHHYLQEYDIRQSCWQPCLLRLVGRWMFFLIYLGTFLEP